MTLIVPYFAETATATIVIDGVTYRVPLIDSAGHLQVDVVTSTLPALAATAAKQDTMITALQLIDDLRAALGSVAGDQLRTEPGWDTLVTEYYNELAAPHGGTERWLYTVPDGRFAIVTHCLAYTAPSTAASSVEAQITTRDTESAVTGYVARALSLIAGAVVQAVSPHLILDEGEELRALTRNSDAVNRGITASAHIIEIVK